MVTCVGLRNLTDAELAVAQVALSSAPFISTREPVPRSVSWDARAREAVAAQMREMAAPCQRDIGGETSEARREGDRRWAFGKRKARQLSQQSRA